MDRPGADFERCMEMMRARLHANPVAIQIPLGSEEFHGVIDLVENKADHLPRRNLGAEFDVEEIPGRLQGHRPRSIARR